MIAVDAMAYMSDQDFGYDRWCASQITCGRGTHEAVILVFKDATEKQAFLQRRKLTVTTKWDAQP